MWLSRADFKGRVNGRVEYRFGLQQVTSHAGLELIREFLQGRRFRQRVRRLVGNALPATDFGAVAMVHLLLGLVMVGGRRIWHLRYLQSDPILARFSGLRRLPSTRTVSGWLAQMSSSHVARLVRLNSEVVGESLNEAGLARLTIDVDGSVVSTGQTVEGAKRGFNPHHRKVPSYYPITAYEAQSGQILRVENRPGNVHDGKASLGFLEELVDQIEETVDRSVSLEFRMDGAFFRRDVLEFLESAGAEYAIKVPFYPWLHLKTAVALAPEWIRIDDTVSFCETRTLVAAWNQVRRIVRYRKRVAHETRKNFQLDLFGLAAGMGGCQDIGNAVLQCSYSWESSTGKLGDLSACRLREFVTYPHSINGSFRWPDPPWDFGNPSPTEKVGPAAVGGALDFHLSGVVRRPITQGGGFTATQVYQYKCPCTNGGDWKTVRGPLTISRIVGRNADGDWVQQTCKEGVCASAVQ